MWKDYSWSYIKNNRASGISVMVAAFISALLLSLLCSLFYNLWSYEVDRLELEEGDWQGRIVGEIDTEDLATIQNYANVERAVINEELSSEQGIVVDVYFENMRTILTDMPRIADLAGLPAEATSYHYALLNMYLIRDPEDPAPRMIFPFFIAVTLMASVSLIMIIHNAFAVSMNERIHQFGIFSSIGATPKQIRTCLLQEAFVLCSVPIVLGNLLGVAASMGILQGSNVLLSDVSSRMEAAWGYHPLILVFSLLATIVTIWISAWIPARKLSRLTPLEAIRNTGELQLKRKKNSRILWLLFGMEGELAGNAWKAQKKAMRTASASLVISFLAFTLMQCFFTLSGISQRETYFERYQDAWDVMVTMKDTEIDEVEETEALQGLFGVRSGVVYQKAMAKRIISEEELSQELRAIGGLQNAAGSYVLTLEGAWLINVPIVILDDVSFLEYCKQIGAPLQLDGAVVINRIRELTNTNFRDVQYLPYLNEMGGMTVLRPAGQDDVVSDTSMNAEIPVIFYTQQLPVLKEAFGELDYYVLVHVLPLSVWKEIKGQVGGAETDTYVRILAKEGVTLKELNELETAVSRLLCEKYETEIENRIQDKLNNDNMINGMMAILGGFCVLLAIIGMGNIFSNTLGFVRQRGREFARYMSVGLTPEGIKKMFCVEALVIAGRPLLFTLPLTVIAVGFMISASYLDPMVFIREAPVIPILTFIFGIFAFVGLAYYLGGRKVLKSSLVEALRDDTVM